jgi:hypothetical protein
LPELHGKPLPQHAIEHRIASHVAEISKNNGVAIGQRKRTIELRVTDDDCHGCCGGGRDDSPVPPR